MGGCRYLVVVLTLLAVVLLVSCNIEAGDATVYLHGLTDPLTSGVVVTVSSAGGSASSPTNASGAWGVTVKTAAGRLYTLVASAPDGYRVTRIMHPSLGSTAGNVLQFTLDGADLAPDVIVSLAPAMQTPTHAPTLPMPPATPPLGTAEPSIPTPDEPPDAATTPRPTLIVGPPPTLGPRPTPTLICEKGTLKLDYQTYLNIRQQAFREVFRLEEFPDPFNDETLHLGLAMFNSAPLSRPFVVTGADGVVYNCRAFASEIIAVADVDRVNSRPMFTTHDRVGVYHWCECGGLSETTWGGFAG